MRAEGWRLGLRHILHTDFEVAAWTEGTVCREENAKPDAKVLDESRQGTDWLEEGQKRGELDGKGFKGGLPEERWSEIPTVERGACFCSKPGWYKNPSSLLSSRAPQET